MSSIVSLIIRNAAGIGVFGGMWLSVTSVQNGNYEFAIIGVLFSIFSLGAARALAMLHFFHFFTS